MILSVFCDLRKVCRIIGFVFWIEVFIGNVRIVTRGREEVCVC